MENTADFDLSNQAEAKLVAHLEQLHDGLANTVDFGVEILLTDFNRGGTDLDLPVLLFFRNLISTVDGVAVLIKHSIIEPANNLLRTALENVLSIKYLLEEDQVAIQRAKSFMIWFFVEQQRWLKKGDVQTVDYHELVKKHKKDKAFNHVPVMVFPMAEEQRKKLEKVFDTADYKETKAEYDRVKSARKGTPMWYHLYDGPKNLEQLADRVGYPAVYEMLYRGLSISSHGNNILCGKVYFDENSATELAQLRDSYGAESIVNHCLNFCRMAYRTVIIKRMPFMAERFNQWLKESSDFNRQLSAMVQVTIDKQNEEMIRAVTRSGNK
jgi:hypothetical protein